METITEIWKDVPGFENLLQCSNFGKARTIKNPRVKFLKTQLNRKGYQRIRVSFNAKKYGLNIHRIVAQTFIPNPNNLPQVNHKDCNKLNNHIENLEWISNIDNIRHAFKNGVFKERDKTTILNIKHMKKKLCP